MKRINNGDNKEFCERTLDMNCRLLALSNIFNGLSYRFTDNIDSFSHQDREDWFTENYMLLSGVCQLAEYIADDAADFAIDLAFPGQEEEDD